MDWRRSGAWAGMLGSALFVAVFTIEGWLRPGYDPFSMYISALSMGPRGAIQIANFITWGGLVLLFARGVAAEFGKSARIGVALLAIIGIGFLGSGPFVIDPVTVSTAAMSLHGKLHNFFGVLVFGLSPICCFVFFSRFSKDPHWRPLRWWTLTTGIAMVAAIGVLKAAQLGSGALHALVGAIQRATLIPWLAWVFVFGWVLRSRANECDRQGGGTDANST